MERGLLYLLVFLFILFLVTAGSIRKGFQSAKFLLSLTALFFMPGLVVAFGKGMLLLFVRKELWIPVAAGIVAGIILYKFIFRRLWGFSTFEHELSHALVALLFFRRIKKFVVTRFDGGYIEYTDGFGGKTGNHFIALGPYFLPTFTLLSVMVRPLLTGVWFPWFDVWIGITFSYQTFNNIDELQRNWTRERFLPAGGGGLTNTDIGREGYIFSFILILALKLLFLGFLLFILSGGYQALPHWLASVWNKSIDFFEPVVSQMYGYVRSII